MSERFDVIVVGSGAGGGVEGMVAMFGGRCVGGTTTINTKVALRAHEMDHRKWQEASGCSIGVDDLAPFYERVETALGVRERSDWTHTVYMLQKGFQAVGADLEPVHSYTDENCMKCGSCL